MKLYITLLVVLGASSLRGVRGQFQLADGNTYYISHDNTPCSDWGYEPLTDEDCLAVAQLNEKQYEDAPPTWSGDINGCMAAFGRNGGSGGFVDFQAATKLWGNEKETEGQTPNYSRLCRVPGTPECTPSDDTALTAACECGDTAECAIGSYCVTGDVCQAHPSDCTALKTLYDTGTDGTPCCSDSTGDCATWKSAYNSGNCCNL